MRRGQSPLDPLGAPGRVFETSKKRTVEVVLKVAYHVYRPVYIHLRHTHPLGGLPLISYEYGRASSLGSDSVEYGYLRPCSVEGVSLFLCSFLYSSLRRSGIRNMDVDPFFPTENPAPRLEFFSKSKSRQGVLLFQGTSHRPSHST
jgi:hypothetical protein